MQRRSPAAVILLLAALAGCAATPPQTREAFRYDYGGFADVGILAYPVPGFDELPTRQKELLYYLAQAGYAGRDIMYDQNYRHNLRVRRTLEAVVRHYDGELRDPEFERFMTYTRQVWFSNGIHHHYSTLKLQPAFSNASFSDYVRAVATSGELPLLPGESVDDLLAELTPVIFDPAVAPKKVETAPGVDKVRASAVNFYAGVTEQEVRDFYAQRIDPQDPTPVSWGLNSQLVKRDDGSIAERAWKVGGMYGQALEQVVYWLEKAAAVAENGRQRRSLELLIDYYRSGDLATFDAHSIAWVEDNESRVDLMNGFIEVYNDPIAYRGSYEAIVSFRDEQTNDRIATIAANAQWFEDHMPIMQAHKKPRVKGILGSAITVVAEAGDASPSTPVGVNLPNADWIRRDHGSKSVTLSNVFSAYYSMPDKALQEFAWDQAEIARAQRWREIASALIIDMHEVIGHASGRINPGVGTPKETLKQYASTLEEGRADLVALYYIMDPKLVELGVMPDLEVGKTAYDRYIRGGLLTQYYRVGPGEELEEAHMRNRALVAGWAYDRGREDKVIERRERDGKTYFVINDYQALRALFAELLRELQRIKSEGDFDAIAHLVEAYGTRVDPQLHAQVLRRYAPLDIPPYRGFVNPVLTPVRENGRIVDVTLAYPASFDEQMLYYAQHYSFLPHRN
ncbi:MAG: dihydrofolate reductase [Halioglobus sp.]|nr:dihydrofolate reductase [Halioglobus sp.]|tara:strand:- start:1401 stop:3446 length:2046 start_codon:yes stop_codon:yes gene_type:complete